MGSYAPIPSSALFIFEIAFKASFCNIMSNIHKRIQFINSDGLLVPIKNDVIPVALWVQNKFAYRPSNSRQAGRQAFLVLLANHQWSLLVSIEVLHGSHIGWQDNENDLH